MHQITSARAEVNLRGNKFRTKHMPGQAVMDRWNERIVEGITKFLTEKQYPENLSKDEKRNYRKRAQDFIVLQGKLHYKCKESGQTRMAISSEEDKERIFKVMFFFCLTVSNPAYSQSKT